MEKTYFKSRLRQKGQITVPQEIRELLGAVEGDDLLFSTDDHSRVIVSRAQIIDPDQEWFWSERWQHMEHEAQADLDAGRVNEYESVEDALFALEQTEMNDNAED